MVNKDTEYLQDLINQEKERQQNEICLIASENYTSPTIRNIQGSILTNKYAEGYPNARYYGGCQIIDKIETLAIEKAKELFNCKWANVQPHSGSQANQSVYLALLQPHDTILGMDLNAGGHLTHGSKVSASGKLYNAVSYGLDENGIINYYEIEQKLTLYRPKLLIVGASAYSRIIDFERIRKIVDNHNFYQHNQCYFMVDMAHIAGLVAAGLHPSPLPYADVVTSTTHKTLRGPRGGIILSNNEELGKKIDKAVFPGIQGGPLEHIIGAKAQCFIEALQPSFKNYQERVLSNIKAMEEIFASRNVKMISNGSDNHLILLDLRDKGISGKLLEDALSEVGIVVNKNAVQNDPRPKKETSGIRLGTACITTRGMDEKESRWIATVICNIIDVLSGEYDWEYIDTFKEEDVSYDNMSNKDILFARIRKGVISLCQEHPINEE